MTCIVVEHPVPLRINDGPGTRYDVTEYRIPVMPVGRLAEMSSLASEICPEQGCGGVYKKISSANPDTFVSAPLLLLTSSLKDKKSHGQSSVYEAHIPYLQVKREEHRYR